MLSVTNVETGMPEYIQIKDMFKQMDAVRAIGILMPYLSEIIVANRRHETA